MLGVTLGSLYVDTWSVFLRCYRICVVCLVLELLGSWVVFFFFGVGMEAFGWSLISVVKNLPANSEDMGSVPGSGRSPGEGNSNPLKYSCLGNPMY